jgi:hypothetical protein
MDNHPVVGARRQFWGDAKDARKREEGSRQCRQCVASGHRGDRQCVRQTPTRCSSLSSPLFHYFLVLEILNNNKISTLIQLPSYEPMTQNDLVVDSVTRNKHA